MPNADVVIVGSGLAALCTAEKLCQQKNVIIITKRSIKDNNSYMAQGGIAAAIALDDHWCYHYQDTMEAGCYHNNPEAVSYLVQQGSSEIRKLLREGMLFDQDESGLSLGREGAHGKRRILHAGGDATGKYLLEHMLEKVKKHVTIIEHEMVLDLIIEEGICKGIITRDNQQVTYYYAPHTVLATGGIGALYAFSSNQNTITGDGIAMAYRAGAKLADLEFVQFHPTMLYVDGACKGLISEAVRGEGAVLRNSKGEQFMKRYAQGDLSPRDVVSRAIHEQMLQGEKVYLDITPVAGFVERFPSISALCDEYGVCIAHGKIPVVPGAHFHMGGIATNLDGETSVPGLYAVGEVACNGVHGANRLASNSLLEGLVFGGRLGKYLLQKQEEPFSLPIHKEVLYCNTLFPKQEELQHMMMTYAGIVRTEEGLQHAQRWLNQYTAHTENAIEPTNEQMKMKNMLLVAWLIVTAALNRRNSIGGHFRKDFPHREASELHVTI
ncbi:L-aspartate oxidase [Ectobacillus antri]|jgi:L-aspartate oxidase|uniref:L-aspartate oxidase n=1 Tax=Ectobacillus antri TaxID=2486280 RepID=A0ABT6H418_9BACI|nr:L-aspartate oxidase [Ectobacillus antri]MDG4655383.1 L-aspartate oxidase [Ectobacillus antri]MDG5753141.1 L-aspartate oxidase [Ectobacillus antri]